LSLNLKFREKSIERIFGKNRCESAVSRVKIAQQIDPFEISFRALLMEKKKIDFSFVKVCVLI